MALAAPALAGLKEISRLSIYARSDRLAPDPAMRWVVGGGAVMGQAASASQIGRFETEAMTQATNLDALADLNGQWIDRVRAQIVTQRRFSDPVSWVILPRTRTDGQPIWEMSVYTSDLL